MTRTAEHEIARLFLDRWSPRAMDGTPLSQEEVMRLFEAARWAPSGGNLQPWRFAYALAGTPAFDVFYDLLNEGNRTWCARAGALIVVASKTTRANGQPNRTHALDTGAAWMSLALQGHLLGLVVHGMGGFDAERARAVTKLPEGFEIMHMVAVGHPGRLEDLSERDRAREVPSGRNPVTSFTAEGVFPAG